MRELWGIYYTDIYGQRKRYMDIGFESYELAWRELERIKRSRLRNKDKPIILGKRLPAALYGKNWKIKKIKITPIT